MGERTGENSVLVENPEGNKPLGRTRHRFENNSKTDLQVMTWRRGLN
jgi:hypothetical protein